MKNHLKDQTSPYLLQHANNPVDWYPWCEEAFERAKAEDKPIFLSIGYSTCHWCHVMAHESFEDGQVAEILNRYFISIKVDKEERPDIDSIYMSVCQAFTGSGGWPTSIFMTPDQKPFFAGTYFPKTAKFGQFGFISLLLEIRERWENDREGLLKSADSVISILKQQTRSDGDVSLTLCLEAVKIYKQTFDNVNGGFGQAPKFPMPHNLLFLLNYYERSGEEEALKMVEKTLFHMYRGGIFDHIGGGFSRYSTDRFFLVPHFEKMLYDNALLILAYAKAFQITGKQIYKNIAEKTAAYILREMTSGQGGFYSAQDADSEGVEGKYYLFEPIEIINLLGEKKGKEFCSYFDITEQGNFEGKNIPNLLNRSDINIDFEDCINTIYEYRKKRFSLHLDDKILTSWNSLMIVAMCHLYRVTGKKIYLAAASNAQKFIKDHLYENGRLYVSYRDGQHSGMGFLDDYANQILALLALYEATLEQSYLEQSRVFCEKVISDFYDEKHGGFFLYGKENEELILRPKETYDGAIFSGNSAMAYNLVHLYYLTGEQRFGRLAERQLSFMSGEAEYAKTAHAMFLLALLDYLEPPKKITIVFSDTQKLSILPCQIPLNTVIHVLNRPTKEYPLKNNKTTYYVCQGHSCQPPVNELGWT